MQRHIKFRVWSISSKSWICDYSKDWVGTGIGNVGSTDTQPWKCMSLNGKIMSNDNMGAFVDNNQEDYVIQQATGVSDMNGKEIYEGDAIRYRGGVGIVRYSAGAYRCEWTDQTDDDIGLMVTTDMEIVGVKT